MSKFPVSAKAILKKFRAARVESLLPVTNEKSGTVLAGIPQIPIVNATGNSTPSINDIVGAVTDITDPENTGGWTTLCEYIGATPFYAELSEYNNTSLKIALFKAEDAGDALRMQVLVDGQIAWDAYGVADGTTAEASVLAVPMPGVGADYIYPIFCNVSFQIRAARVGSLSNNLTLIYNSSISIRRLK